MNETQVMIEELMQRAKIAQQEYSKLTQEDVDRIVKQMAMAVLENHMMLARLAVEETKRGIYEDKITKNIFASEYSVYLPDKGLLQRKLKEWIEEETGKKEEKV